MSAIRLQNTTIIGNISFSQFSVALGSLALGVMAENALALGTNLRGSYRMGNIRGKHLDFAAVGITEQGADVLCVVGAFSDPQGSLSISLGHQQPDNIPTTLATVMGKVITDTPLEYKEGIPCSLPTLSYRVWRYHSSMP